MKDRQDAPSWHPYTRDPLSSLRLAALLALALFAWGCGSTSTSLLGPSDSRCTIALSGGAPPLDAAGGSGSITVTTARDCTWSSASEADWLTITSGQAGQGNGRVEYTAAGNPAPSTRRGAVVIGERRMEILQAGVPCEATLSSAGETFGAAGGTATVGVTTLDGCSWSAMSHEPWIVIASGSGNGSGSVTLSAAANSGPPRTGTVTIAGQPVTVSQEASCTYGLSPTDHLAPVSGGTVPVHVVTQPWCDWIATGGAAWIAIAAGDRGTGGGTVSLSVAANGGPPRTGTVTIAGHAFTVTQAAACDYSLSRTSQLVTFAGGSFSVDIVTQPWCDWIATSNDPWIAITGGDRGTGTGTVNYQVSAHVSLFPRTGTIAIADQTLTVNQALLGQTAR